MESEEIQEVAFNIILNSGDARTLVHEGFKAMRDYRFVEAEDKLEEANESLIKAHNIQTELLHNYAGGSKINMEVIMVHAQDHLMTTMTLREVALEMLMMYKKIEKVN
ncbi:MAG: PTS cellobiose transporter subunit IIA [Staphylococcus equorum]|uniref:PTS system, cellobiose-specific IIA component n=1 Tax=Alkalibacterium gilvum TaxID=1130080 RepID=A0A1H6SWL9_9LACT|nr:MULTISPECIES: PTS cellobiose transporter subunit IIA [Alkalibacterium]MDN6742787.1 PTS cellobiose transporter subunit IIA [Staphylococcus equorum]MDN6294287.1 PTS cellobiose transporter subunit IIA [Alkalibacterium sp.]MDN6295931.1 PTS cellobiose transporter subunit IIA [Alkalibacterium sp.]SEI67962.1 PTS system, cellobiose-specific IIA component [Alkalibacterium gilvum]HAJ70372.1 PTS cellobiose transporter subunit IIA [Alkalibacterium sp.]